VAVASSLARDSKQGQSSSSSSAPSSTLQGQDLVEQSWKVLARLLVFPAPTIALLNGHAFGLGLFLALACDHRIMIDNDDDSSIPSKGSPKLCLPEITIGLPLGSGFAALAKCKMPKDTLRTAALTGKQYQSQDALKAGIIDAILPSSSDEKAALPMQVVTMAANLVPTSAKGNLPAIKMELYGETYKELVTGKSQAKL
jgi:Delta3-Delta2-enoyl-CoA isomerase